jgi:hypothetical protein
MRWINGFTNKGSVTLSFGKQISCPLVWYVTVLIVTIGISLYRSFSSAYMLVAKHLINLQ